MPQTKTTVVSSVCYCPVSEISVRFAAVILRSPTRLVEFRPEIYKQQKLGTPPIRRFSGEW
ncbi:MAG: hypothetical protein ABR906_08660, partial [Terracidiphilus sp.]